MHIGGKRQFSFGQVKTQAFHGSQTVRDGRIVNLGFPTGIVFTIEDKNIYFAGDTGLFSDMKLIGELNPLDVAFLPIGDNFTMGPEDAAIAARFLQAKLVVPMHYNTFPLIAQDPKVSKSNKIGMGERVVATKHEQILKYIENLAVGEKISVRKIAKNLSVSEGTAYRAIKDAEIIGFVSTIKRVGTLRLNGNKKIVSKN
ncbi:UPF0173 metal-dependent hydrolase LMHCC_0991 [Listeria monocytogenes N53-1]|nr:UPF0173 metal-dependent hydrolase LMHCC_0991 [Listeria monocytogenes N53-1]